MVVILSMIVKSSGRFDPARVRGIRRIFIIVRDSKKKPGNEDWSCYQAYGGPEFHIRRAVDLSSLFPGVTKYYLRQMYGLKDRRNQKITILHSTMEKWWRPGVTHPFVIQPSSPLIHRNPGSHRNACVTSFSGSDRIGPLLKTNT
jgi:hypothetical protein